MRPFGNGSEVRHVKGLSCNLFGAILGDETIKPIFAAAYRNDKYTGLDDALCQGEANAGCCTCNEYGLVREGHCCCFERVFDRQVIADRWCKIRYKRQMTLTVQSFNATACMQFSI